MVPSDLYSFADKTTDSWYATVNGIRVESALENGYLVIDRQWRRGDRVQLHLDMSPRFVAANGKVADDRGRLCVERGPLVYCAEWCDNDFDIRHFVVNRNKKMTVEQ